MVRIGLSIATTLVLVFWALSNWSVVCADVGSNALNPKGIGFFSSPVGLNFSLLDRAWITNSVNVIDVGESPSGWDWDVMQEPFDGKWSFVGISFCYRTRQCRCMLAITYPATLTILASVRLALWYTTNRKADQQP